VDDLCVRVRHQGSITPMSVAQLVVMAGGFATRADLVRATSRADVDRALAAGEIVADGRGRYATPATDEAVRAAHGLSGVLGTTSAALFHGWEVLHEPVQPHVVVPRRRKVSAARRAGTTLHYVDLEPEQVVDGIATDVETTLLHCLTRLPRADALAVADSALRHGVPPAVLRRIARTVRGPGARQAKWVAKHADGDAANPFESGLRNICLDVEGLDVQAQRTVSTGRITARPDLVDADLQIALEADSFEWHGGRSALARDARRYNLLVVGGWVVLRFSWEDVMFDPDYVRAVLVAVVALVRRRADQPCRRCCAA
jgi:very-short-patch-repair endonuclease